MTPTRTPPSRLRRALLLVVAAAALAGTQPLLAADVGQAPKLKGVQLSGEVVNLADLRGKVVMVNFWATWCGVCAAEMPGWQKFYEAYKAKGFELVAVSIDDEEAPIRRRVTEKKFTFPVVWRFDDHTDDDFGDVVATPTLYLLDRTGKVALATRGRISEATLRQAVDRLLN